MNQVKKRDGSIVDFDHGKIEVAIKKALVATGIDDMMEVGAMARSAWDSACLATEEGHPVSVEVIQDKVEKELMLRGYLNTARAFILYREQHKKARDAHGTLIDYKKLIDKYLKVDDWRVKENSTVSYSIGGLILSNSGAVTANYWLSEIYDKDIADAHRNADIHLHDLSMLSPYCAGWSLRQLITEGFGGVKGKVSSSPAKHLNTLCNQMVNFFGCLQNEWAGAQAFSSFDTYLAPFVRTDNLTYEQVKHCVESFVYGLNTPSRWGCVPITTKVGITRGWVGYDELEEGNLLATWKDSEILVCRNNKTVVKDYDGDLCVFYNDEYKYRQSVTEEHRVIVYDSDGKEHILTAKEVYDNYTKYRFPYLTVDDICTDGKKNPELISVSVSKEHYSGKVWCPSSDNGTAVFKDEFGHVFISGNSQPPFTNITLDLVPPPDLADLPAIVGGVEQDFTYGDCQKEMDIVNKAFLEVMLEGDADGRVYSYPIPTYSITRDFDWSDTELNKLLFSMAAKYGIPYFSNYVNSDMSPQDVRSMAILPSQEVIYRKTNGRISKSAISKLYANWSGSAEQSVEYEVLWNGKFVPVTEMFEIPYDNYDTFVEIKLGNGEIQRFSYDHKCVVVRDGKIQDVLSQDVKTTDKFLLSKKPYNDNDGDSFGTYESGKIIGYYLAEGWVGHNGTDINFAINYERNDIVDEIQSFFENMACRVRVDYQPEVKIYKVYVYGRRAASFCTDFVSGGNAKEKRFTTSVWDTSCSFRKGIYDGYYDTDGSDSCKNFAHTTNKELISDLVTLGASVGKYFRYRENPNNTRYFKKDKSDRITFTSYKLMCFEPESYNDDYYVVGVSEVCEKKSRLNYVYNFTVDTPEHLYTLPNGVVTHQCCRLRLSLRELSRKNGGFFGSGESTGSIGVVSINMPRLAYKSANEEEFFSNLGSLMDLSARSLHTKRTTVVKLMDAGLYPYTKRYLGTFANHFNTIGPVGFNEACLNAKWLGKDLTNEESQAFVVRVLEFMRDKLSDYQEQYKGELFNLESIPAESTCLRFALHDKEVYPDIITAGNPEDGGRTPYYTNSSNLPVGATDDVFEMLDSQDKLQPLYTGGTVAHIYLGERLTGWKSAANLVKRITDKYKLPYITLSPTFSVCPNGHGYITGEVHKCPECGSDTEVYSRITGYYRMLANWNDGKTQEFADRKEYVVE